MTSHWISVAEFLLTERCPDEWRSFDLYILRDNEVVFYVGQSRLAFDRVWQHLGGGFKGRSLVGQFILCNWPVSMRFEIELLSSRSSQFTDVEYDLSAAENMLIEQLSPCLNTTLNHHPAPLPARYVPPNGNPHCPRNMRRLIVAASYAVKAARRQKMLEDLIDL